MDRNEIFECEKSRDFVKMFSENVQLISLERGRERSKELDGETSLNVIGQMHWRSLEEIEPEMALRSRKNRLLVHAKKIIKI